MHAKIHAKENASWLVHRVLISAIFEVIVCNFHAN